MASAVLGKRTRNSRDEADAASPVPTRSKRRTQFVIAPDQENENPFVTPRSSKRNCIEDGESMEVDELAQENTPRATRKRRVVASTVPAKHGTPQSRVVVQPSRPRLARVDSVTDASSTTTSSPTTPRHRDAAPKKVQITPRHRVGLIGKPLTPHTPRTPVTPRSGAPTVYNAARQLFARSGEHSGIIGRSSEKVELGNFISTRLESSSSGCIYISGPPGTGKSALVNEVCQEFRDADTCSQSYINCMGIKHARDIFSKLFEDFSANDGILRGSESDLLKEMFFARNTSYVVVLDEIDYLLDIDLELLYSLFEWSLNKRSSLILIGIANALDFTDRFLPRLKSRGLKPHLLPIMPYTGPQIAAVITGKLKALMPTSSTAPDFVPFLHPTAILFLSKKVASTGDLRRAFDICRRVIDLIETETREMELRKQAESTPDFTPTSTPSKTPLVENINLSSPPLPRSPAKSPQKLQAVSPKRAVKSSNSPLAHLTPETAPRATIAHMARVTSAIFNSGATQRLQGLNVQQKAVLCALVGLEERNRRTARDEASLPDTPSRRGRGTGTSAPTVKQLFDIYSRACREEKILHALTSTEFSDVVGSLETLSLVSALDGRNGSFQAVTASGTQGRRGRPKGFGTLSGAKAGEEKRVASSVGIGEIKTMVVETKAGRGILEGFLEGQE